MTVLSDGTIRRLMDIGEIVIDPMPEDRQFQPVSVDLKLESPIKLVRSHWDHSVMRWYEPILLPYRLNPGECVLASTVEHVELSDSIVARVEGKSTLGRLFITVHKTAGLIDPGFAGQITLEIKNNGPAAVMLEPDMKICQIVFERTDLPVERLYGSPELGSNYQYQHGATEPKTRGLV